MRSGIIDHLSKVWNAGASSFLGVSLAGRIAMITTIEWTNLTLNIARGCRKVSPGCKHCYAERLSERFRGVEGHHFENGFDPQLVPDRLLTLFKFTRPMKIFVNSMSDFFLEDFPTEYLMLAAHIMMMTPWHMYQILTKRSRRMRELLQGPLRFAAAAPHIAWGVSVEDRAYGLPRIDHLREVGAVLPFLSIEPLLEDISPELNLEGMRWVIVGGESGPHARPMLPNWVTPIFRQCRTRRIPFFFKQWGGVQKGKTGRRLRGRLYSEFPLMPFSPVPSHKIRQAMATQMEPEVRAWETVSLIPPSRLTQRLASAIEHPTGSQPCT